MVLVRPEGLPLISGFDTSLAYLLLETQILKDKSKLTEIKFKALNKYQRDNSNHIYCLKSA